MHHALKTLLLLAALFLSFATKFEASMLAVSPKAHVETKILIPLLCVRPTERKIENSRPVWSCYGYDLASGVSVNWYAYVGGDPVNNTDPTGYMPNSLREGLMTRGLDEGGESTLGQIHHNNQYLDWRQGNQRFATWSDMGQLAWNMAKLTPDFLFLAFLPETMVDVLAMAATRGGPFALANAVPKVNPSCAFNAGKLESSFGVSKGLRTNPFKGKSPQQIDELLTSRGFKKVGKVPMAGKGAYFHPKTGRKYYIDPKSSTPYLSRAKFPFAEPDFRQIFVNSC